MIFVGTAAKMLREKLGLTQVDAAAKLGVTNVYLSNLENDKAAPTRKVLEKFQQTWGIDLYVFSWCLKGDLDKLPPSLREPARKLTEAWKKQIDELPLNTAK